ncbi:strawberry notch C-terminal domain-containing protein [Aquimarina pacifica]|uniref:strawberry notch C-terminal domain-containing protein n=1 Tax=Aquimarina pacifica TaxID=1296415 RepID=UPI00046FB9AB|nr:strawberry notch C-terminal domain-containing protein [Aquimarina pacifica]
MEDQAIISEQEVFTQDADQLAKMAAQQTALVPYLPKSQATFQMHTLIPRNIAFEVQKSLNALVKEKGTIDNYVRNELKYISTAILWKAFSKEQIDGIGLYLQQFERGQGLIIADQTGIGKGRQAAAIIRHAKMQGYLPVFFTKSANLYTDMYRDLKAIQTTDINPFILNTTNADVRDTEGQVVFRPLSAKAQYELLTYSEVYPTESPEAIAWYKEMGLPYPDPEEVPQTTIIRTKEYLQHDYDCIFTTYSQIQSAHPYKRTWLEKVIKNGVEGSKKYKKVVFVLDESHIAGGYDSKIGIWMRGVLPHVKSCCFLSATFAKNPKVMPFYAKKTAMMEAGLSDEELVDAMTNGGLALQEIIAPNLSESGQLVLRQRSNKGVQVDYMILDQEPARSRNRERVNRIIGLMNDVVDFEKNYITAELQEIHREAQQVDETISKKPSGLGVKQAPYFSRVFNIIDQLLFALKVEEVAKKTLELLRQDKKVVIAFKSTMGAFLKDMNVASGDILEKKELDFSRTLIKGLESILGYTYTDIAGKKSHRKVDLHGLPKAALLEYKRIKKNMELESTGLTISPIDQLIRLLQGETKPPHLGGHDGAFFKVAEVTGRKQRLYFEEDTAVVGAFKSDTEESFRLFNNGTFDVLLINQSGSTGASAHASKEFKDQRQRIMISHQFELDINIEIQKIGRINRTGQVQLPAYLYIASDIPMEVRLMTMLKGKLKSLDANTTGSQNTSDTTFKSPDLFNKYGDQVAFEWVDENPMLTEKLGHPTYSRNWGGELVRKDSKKGAIRQLTGRAGLLKVEDQDVLFNDLLARYTHRITLEKQQGTYDLETEFLPLDADIQKRFLQYRGTGGKTPFGRDAIRDQTIINNLNRPFTQAQIQERLQKTLEQGTPEVIKTQFLEALEEAYPKLIAQRKEKRRGVIEQMTQELEEMPEIGAADSEEENEKIALFRERQQDRIDQKRVSLTTYLLELESIYKKIKRYAGYWVVGEVVKVPFVGSMMEASWGIFLGFKMGASANPYTLSNISFIFAVADGRKTITYDLKNGVDYLSTIYAESKEITQQERETVPTTWNALIKNASVKREKRFILTENILAVSGEIDAHNRLIKYNTTQGTLKNGILMAREFGKEGGHYALVPISEGITKIRALETDTVFEDHTLKIKFKRIGEQHLQVYINKKSNYLLAIEPSLRRLILQQEGQSPDELAEFIQNGGDMTAVLSMDRLFAFLKALDGFGIKIQGKAEELEDWEIENQIDWNKRTGGEEVIYTYELGRAYGNGSNPVDGFIDYKEPDATFPYGRVSYNRSLRDKEKYTFSLIPVFKNIAIPVLAWKSAIKSSPIAKELKNTLKEVAALPLHKAIERLGYFVFNHPHENGNPEFVFGRYTPQEFGEALYEDMITPIEPIDILLDRMQLYQELKTTTYTRVPNA